MKTKLKLIGVSLLIWIVMTIFFYLTISFIELRFNFYAWDKDYRSGYIYLIWVFIPLSLLLATILLDECD